MNHIIGQKKKVFFVSSMTGGAYMYRCYLPMKFLNNLSNRYECEGDVDVATRTRRKNPKAVMESDIVIYHRPQEVTDLQFLLALKKKGKKIIYSNDDTYKIDLEHNVAQRWRDNLDVKDKNEKARIHQKIINRYEEIAKRAMDASDRVIASTEFLAKEYKKTTAYKKVEVVPNFIDALSWPKPKRNPDPEEVRIGLSGSVARMEDAKEIEDALSKLAERDNVKFVIQGFQSEKRLEDNPKLRSYIQPHIDFWKNFGEDKVEFHDYAFPLSYSHALNNMQMDLMLIPRRDNYFNRCKSNLKFLEAGMLKVPTVCTQFLDKGDPYSKDIKDGENGFLVHNEEEFLKKAEKLVEDKSLRKKMGKKANEYVKDNYAFRNNYKRWEKAIDESWM